MPPEQAFGRSVCGGPARTGRGAPGYEQASGNADFELGGYPVVADALRGYIRDDTLVLDRIYRVVARPVELDTSQLPAGRDRGRPHSGRSLRARAIGAHRRRDRLLYLGRARLFWRARDVPERPARSDRR